VGSTAVVALVSANQVVVANCGDSRAVLCRGGEPVALSRDHKAECPDEAARVKAAGGDVLFCRGPRVMGVLAMSRAIGDHFLRPFIIPEPEVTVTERMATDEFVVLWDVVANGEVCSLVQKSLARMAGEGRPLAVALRMTAAVVVKAALARGSTDNISVVIVDMADSGRRPSSGTADATDSTTSDVRV
jgi:protein phosphatase 2C